MAASASRVQTGRPMGSDYYTITNVTCDNSYESEGEKVAPREFGLRRVTFAICTVINGTESATVRAVTAFYTPSTEKLHLIDSATGKEVEATKDMSKVVVQVVAFGKP
jgi:hypothetical protein